MTVMTANREPIFKLSWVGFPDQNTLRTMQTEGGGEPLSGATIDYAERGENMLLILGGQSPGETPGINVLTFPAYVPPGAQIKVRPIGTSEALPLHERYAYRDSLAPTGSAFYPTRTPPEDFILLPRSSPYFGLTHDPIAIVVSLTPNPEHTRVSGPAAERGIEAWVFPPPRSGVIPPSPGRKNFIQPGEGERFVAMTPAPFSSSPGSPTGSWRMRFSPSSRSGSPSGWPSSPSLRVPTPDSMLSPGSTRSGRPSLSPGRLHAREMHPYRIASSLWSGRLTVLTADVHSLPTPVFKRLISWSIEHVGETNPRVPIRGGMAVPDLQSHGAPDVKVVKMESYRVLATSHPDATVRFWDISPHLLVLPTPLRFEYPGPLPHLSIYLGHWLTHPHVAHLPLARLWASDRSKVVIKSVHLAREALECTITMKTGEIIVTKFHEARTGSYEEADKTPRDSYFPTMPPAMTPAEVEEDPSEWIEEVLEIGHLAKYSTDGFKPVAIFTPKRGQVTHCAVSDIGFIAVAFTTKSLAIIDMRGPDVILREGFDEGGANVKKRKKGNVQNVPGEGSPVGSLKWTVAGLGNGTPYFTPASPATPG